MLAQLHLASLTHYKQGLKRAGSSSSKNLRFEVRRAPQSRKRSATQGKVRVPPLLHRSPPEFRAQLDGFKLNDPLQPPGVKIDPESEFPPLRGGCSFSERGDTNGLGPCNHTFSWALALD